MIAEDRTYILDSFLKGYGRNSSYTTGIPAQVIMSLIEPLLVLWNTDVALDESGHIVGWICWQEPNRIAWVNVKGDLRNHGIGRALLEHAQIGQGEVLCPFMPTKFHGQNFPRWAESKGYTLRFRPYLPMDAYQKVVNGP